MFDKRRASVPKSELPSTQTSQIGGVRGKSMQRYTPTPAKEHKDDGGISEVFEKVRHSAAQNRMVLSKIITAEDFNENSKQAMKDQRLREKIHCQHHKLPGASQFKKEVMDFVDRVKETKIDDQFS